MKYIKIYENIKEIKYIGKYIIFKRKGNLFYGKVINITKREFSDYDVNKLKDLYFIKISNLYPKIKILSEEKTIKFFLEKMNIIKSFDTEIEAKEFFNILKDSEKYNL